MFILDTNVVSELMKASADLSVRRWTNAQDAGRLFTTAISLAEIALGVERLPMGRRRLALRTAADAMFAEEFRGRILPFEDRAAHAYANIVVQRRTAGRPMTPLDAQIAAITAAHAATLVTRNVADFTGCGFEVLNPWGT